MTRRDVVAIVAASETAVAVAGVERVGRDPFARAVASIAVDDDPGDVAAGFADPIGSGFVDADAVRRFGVDPTDVAAVRRYVDRAAAGWVVDPPGPDGTRRGTTTF